MSERKFSSPEAERAHQVAVMAAHTPDDVLEAIAKIPCPDRSAAADMVLAAVSFRHTIRRWQVAVDRYKRERKEVSHA